MSTGTTTTSSDAKEETTINGLTSKAAQVTMQLERARAHLQELTQRLDGSQPPPSSGDSKKAEHPGELGALENQISTNASLASQINELIDLLTKL